MGKNTQKDSKWFYAEILETRRLRIAIKASYEELAKQYAEDLIRRGPIEMCEAADDPYGEASVDIKVEPEPNTPPRGMQRFVETSFGQVEREPQRKKRHEA